MLISISVTTKTQRCCRGYRGLSKLVIRLFDWLKFMCVLIAYSSQFDLYSKADCLPDRDALMPYYQSLIDKYIPGEIYW